MPEQGSTIKEIRFADGLLEPTLDETKQITLRLYRPEAHDLVAGEEFIGDFFKDGVRLLLRATADTEVIDFSDLTDQEAQEDGFTSAPAAFEGMGKYYKDLTPQSPLAIVRYELAGFGEDVAARLVDRQRQLRMGSWIIRF